MMHNQNQLPEPAAKCESLENQRATTGGSSLQALLERSMRLGQRRVALQRLILMEAFGLAVSQAARDFCSPTRQVLPRREIDRMHRAAQDWVAMVGHRRW